MGNVFELRGVIVPIITPFLENGEVDHSGLERLVDYVVGAGVQGLLVLGSCGEFASLSRRERAEVLKTVIRVNAGRSVIVAGTGDASLKEVLAYSSDAESLGAEAAVVMPPFYYNMTESELVRFFAELDRKCSIPIIAYNIPQFAGNPLGHRAVREISQLKNVIGLKDTGMDFASFFEILRERTNPEFKVYMGDEKHVVPGLLMGADGFVPSIGNVAPKLCVDLFAALDAKDESRWNPLWEEYNAMKEIYGADMWIKAIKSGLEKMGVCQRYMAHPFEPLSDERTDAIGDILRRNGLI